MASLRLGCAIAIFSSLGGLGGCASTYAPQEPPPPRDFSVDDMAIGGSGGNGGDDLQAPADLATATARDLAAAAADLAAPRDLSPACIDDGDGGVAPTLWLTAPVAGGLFAARLRGGAWTALPTTATATAVDDVALAAVGGRPLVAARLHDSTLVAARLDACHGGFAPLAAIAPAAATATRPALVGGTSGDVVFRGAVNGDQRYYWAHFDGTAWGAIATQGNFLSTLPPTAVRAGGAVHAIFAGTDTNLWDGVVQTTGGGTSTQLTGNTSAMPPAAAVAPGGAVHVLYTGTNQHVYWFVTSAPGTVHDLCDGQAAGCFIVTDAAPALAFGSDGNAVAVWHGTDGKLYASRLAGTQWGAATGISGSDTTSTAPAIAGGGGDLADVVYVRSDGTPRHAALGAGGWQAPVTVAAVTLAGAPALAATP
ncbi:MAG TPA: hypothetical protein VF997_18180 [Polyangia bacterium]